jgi:hypothetical protein
VRHSTTAAFVAWSVSVAAVVVVDAVLSFVLGRRQPRRRPAQHLPAMWPGVWPWLVLALVAIVWEALGIDTGRHVPHLTVSALAAVYRPFNAALWLVWITVGLAYGVALAARPGRPGAAERHRGPAGEGRAGVAIASFHWPLVLSLLLPASRAPGVVFWVGWLAVSVIVELVAHRPGGRLVSFETLLGFLSRRLAARLALAAAWAYAGWHLFAH